MRAVIIEDEQNNIDVIKDIIDNYCTNVEIAGIAGTVNSAIQLIKDTNPDVLLLDVELPDGTGFDILKKLDRKDIKVIVTTAYESYAINAIKLSAVDYLLKPIDPEELIEAFKKSETSLKDEKNSLRLEALISNIKDLSDNARKIVIKTAENVYLIDTSDIIYFKSDGSYTLVFVKDARKIMVSKVLKHFVDMLEDFGFVHVHKSYLVNISFLDHFIKKDGGYLALKDGTEVPVSYRKKDKVLKIFDKLSL